MKKLIYLTLLILTIASYSVNAQKDTVLFVYNTDQTAYDQPVADTIASWGYEIKMVSRADFYNNFNDSSDYIGYQLVYISESISSSNANSFFNAKFPIPCLVTEGWAVKPGKWNLIPVDIDSLFTQANSSGLDGNDIKITDNSHYITEIYQQDEIVPWTKIETAGVIGPCGFDLSMHPNAIPLAINQSSIILGNDNLYKTTNLSTLWAVPEEGLNIGDSITNEYKMVLFGVTYNGLGTFASSDFYKIIKRSLEWILTEPVSKDATLTDLQIDGKTIEGFDPGKFDYSIDIAKNVQALPTITVTPAEGATYDIKNGSIIPNVSTIGKSTIKVTAENGIDTAKYTIIFNLVLTDINQTYSNLSKVSFAPNPASGQALLYFNLNRQTEATLSILDITGKHLRQINFNANAGNNTIPVDLSNLQSGIYFYTVNADNDKVSGKICIK